MSLHQPLVVSTTAIAQPQRAQATGALRRHKQPLRTLGAALAGALL